MKKSLFPAGAAEQKRHRVVIYLPSQKADGGPIPNFEKLADQTAITLCGKFGGSTIYPAKGYFSSSQNAVQKEAVHVLEFFCTPQQLRDEEDFVRELLTNLVENFEQDSLACSLDGNMILVPSPK